MQFHFFSNRKGNCTLCDVCHTFWQLCPVLDYHISRTRQPSYAYRINLQQGKSPDKICKSMSYESEESWYIFKPFPQWYVTIILFYVTTICCKRNQVRTREYIRWKDDLFYLSNKTNLMDLITATSLVISLKLDSNRRFFQPCDLKLWWMTSQNYRAPLLHYINLCASSQTHRWIQTGVTVRKH